MGPQKCLPQTDKDMQWPFCPNYAAAIAFSTLFGAITLAHIIQAAYYRKGFCWVICMGAAWETASFVFRIIGAQHLTDSTWNVASNFLVLLAPLWINAFAYMTFARIVYFWLPEKKLGWLKARKLSHYFVWLDIFSFGVQAVGGIMLNDDDPAAVKRGLYIYMGGIGLQEAFVLVFIGLMIKFHLVAKREAVQRCTPWRPILFTLYATLFLITVRIIYRLIEFSGGIDSAIPHNENYFYGFEGTPMIIACLLLAIMHPGRFLVGPESKFSKIVKVKGDRRWWCCGRRSRTKVDPDFENTVTGSPRSYDTELGDSGSDFTYQTELKYPRQQPQQPPRQPPRPQQQQYQQYQQPRQHGRRQSRSQPRSNNPYV